MTEEFPRQTFRRVLTAQDNLRRTLKEWSEEDEVPDFDEELEFRKTLNEATLGLCQNVSFNKVHPAWKNSSLSMIITVLLNSDSPEVAVGSSHDSAGEKKLLPIGVFWEKLLERLNEAVFDNAVNLALKISPEKVEDKGLTHSKPRG